MIEVQFTEHELIDYFKNKFGIKKTRKREYLDNRNYVISVLHEHFNYSENDLACLFKMDRSSINHAKRKAYELLIDRQDRSYISNIRELYSNYPASLNDPEERRNNNHYLIGFSFTARDWYNKLKKAAELENKQVGEYSKKVLLDHLEKLEI